MDNNLRQAQRKVMQDVSLLGRTSTMDVFDGSTATRAIPAPHDKTLLETMGLSKHSDADEFIDKMDEKIMRRG